MQKRIFGAFLVLVLLLGVFGTSTALASPPPFGAELTPLSSEEMAEVDGEWGAELAKTVVGAAVGGVQYLITTPVSDWTWSDGLKHAASGAVAGFVSSLF